MNYNQKFISLLNRRIDEKLLSLNYKGTYKNKRNVAEKCIQKRWDHKIHHYPETLIKMFETIGFSAEPYTAFGLESGYITKWNIENNSLPKWSMYSLCRNMGMDFNVVQLVVNESTTIRDPLPPVTHISQALYAYFTDTVELRDGVLLDFGKLALHLKKINNFIDDADVVSKRYVEEYGVVNDGAYDITTYHLSNKVPNSNKMKYSLSTLLGDELE